MKTPIIFAAAIVVTVLLTILGTTLIEPQLGNEPTIENISQTPVGTFYQPRDVAVNSTGDIFVLDTLNNRVQIFNPSGGTNGTFGFPDNNPNDASLNRAFGIHINSTDFIHITDTFTNVIKVYSPGGTYLKTIGSAGTSSGQYFYPSGIDSNSTHFFIADTFNNRIQITDLSGNTVDTIP